ncbi:MAG: Rrf2 family transcriptional regulator [Lachnospiraceae bacterium]|nr:Rrf2 family transcriptional regulator [Lachnospiraceae bacterium]
MKISTRGRYAVRLMLDIAQNETESEFVRVKDIAKRQDISDKYLEQIIASLKKAGFVKSLRGAQGGYRLSRKTKEYTVGSILRLTEGDLAPVSCLEGGEFGCSRADGCVTVRLWSMINDAINGVIDNVTLEDLIKWQEEMPYIAYNKDCTQK